MFVKAATASLCDAPRTSHASLDNMLSLRQPFSCFPWLLSSSRTHSCLSGMAGKHLKHSIHAFFSSLPPSPAASPRPGVCCGIPQNTKQTTYTTAGFPNPTTTTSPHSPPPSPPVQPQHHCQAAVLNTINSLIPEVVLSPNKPRRQDSPGSPPVVVSPP